MQIIPPADKMAHFIVGVLIYAALHFVGIGFALLMVVIAAIGKTQLCILWPGNAVTVLSTEP